MKILTITLLINVIICSCATLPSKNIPQSFSNSSENGMLIGSIAIKNEKPIFNGYMFYYKESYAKEISADKMIQINPEQTMKMKFKPDFFDQSNAVYFFSIEEKEGNFSFSNFRIFENGGYRQATSNIPINFEFKIEKGKIKYLGEIFVNFNKSTIILKNERVRVKS